MRRRAILILLLAIALAACGFSVDSGEQSGDVPTSPGLPTADDAAAGGTYPSLPPMRAVHEDVRDASPRPFQEARYDETDGSFHVVYETGVEPCYVLGAVEVAEDDEQVTVTLMEGHLPDENGEAPVCIEIAEQASTPVTLDSPLDGRTVIDGATGEQVPVTTISADDAASS